MADEDDFDLEGGEEIVDEDVASEWESMLSEEDDDDDFDFDQMMGADDGVDRTLNQDEIDSLLGFGSSTESDRPKTGIYAMLDKALQSYQRLPLLEVVFDRFVRMLSTSLRAYTSDNVDVDIHSITSLRFEDYINSIHTGNLKGNQFQLI